MKQLTEFIREQRSTNCGGSMEWFVEQDFEVEDADIGHDRDNYNGYQHAIYRFRASDVGRRIRTSAQPNGYRCWWFVTKTAVSEKQ